MRSELRPWRDPQWLATVGARPWYRRLRSIDWIVLAVVVVGLVLLLFETRVGPTESLARFFTLEVPLRIAIALMLIPYLALLVYAFWVASYCLNPHLGLAHAWRLLRTLVTSKGLWIFPGMFVIGLCFCAYLLGPRPNRGAVIYAFLVPIPIGVLLLAIGMSLAVALCRRARK